MYRLVKAVRGDNGKPATTPGIWLDANERTDVVLVGTSRGMVTCRTVNRLVEGDRWC